MRTYRDLWLWLGAALLTASAGLLGIALAYFAKEQSYSLFTSWPWGASLAIFVFAFASFACAVLGKSFPLVKPKFPDIYLDIYGSGVAHTTRELPNDMQVPVTVLHYMVRITNMDNEQNANISVTLFLKLAPGSAGRLGEVVCPSIRWPLDEKLGINSISLPVMLAPGTTKGGDLVFEQGAFLPGWLLADPGRVRLELVDHVSRQRRNIILDASIGGFGRDDMKPSRGGVEILGPEFETNPIQSTELGGANPEQTALSILMPAYATVLHSVYLCVKAHPGRCQVRMVQGGPYVA